MNFFHYKDLDSVNKRRVLNRKMKQIELYREFCGFR